MAKRAYSDEEKANALLALDANGGDASRTARQLGIPRMTLCSWRDGRGTHEAVTQMRQGKRAPLAERLETLAHQIIDLLPGKLEEGSGRDAAVSLGIALEKMQLLRGQPTSVEVVRSDEPTDSERAERITALLDEGRARRAGLAPPPTVQ